MKKSHIKVLPEFYDSYINEIDDMELRDAFKKYGPGLFLNDREKLISLGEKVYEPGKWTVKDIIQHIIDAERIFIYRALCFARNDKTALPGFDENEYTPAANANRRSIDELLEEFKVVRRSSEILFNSFDDEMLMREGVSAGKSVSVVALGFILAGHLSHHVRVLKEKYYPLAVNS